ncbi:MAG: FIVAR domain-containing protein, partial [Bifidobacteriaceae bacterium]|nr:FIVAR domain-containing protein [Bifidobacteriaceae bacterium]
FDNDPTDRVVDALPTDYKFGIESVRSAEQAIAAAVAAAPANAPIILTTGMDSWLTAREAVDLQKTGLSDQQKRQIDYITNTLGRDVIVIVKTSSPMAIDSAVQNNPKVKAILEISHSAQEEGPALVTALFDNGYSVPATGWVPTVGKYTPYSTYTEYPGYIEADRTLPAYSPAGRLSATWYANISDMVGASEDHPAASYRWPDYDEDANDNLSNMNGTIPTGILTYDIVKGERTYQYFNGTPLYSFGYGLTYTTFAYSNVAATAISNGKFTVSGTVRNTGARKSDEVVQIYSSFTGAPSRIVQPNTKLIAFDRIRDIEPGQSRSFSFEIDLVDKLGVWDVEAEDYIVEPGAYSIRAAKSSTDPGTAVVLNVTNANGGRAAATRNVNKQVLADKFDDYSNLSGDVTDIELVSSSVDLYSNTALQFREPGAWVNFKNVSVPAGTNRLSMRVRSDRAADLKVYALPVGANPSALAGATALTTFGLDDSRPIAGIPTGLGIGPISVISTTRPQTGSPAGQNTLDNKGEPYKNAYIKPDWSTVNRSVTGLAGGSYDLYVVSEEPGTQVEWFKFAAGAADTTASVAISNEYSQTSIREKNGSIKLRADLTPVTSTSPVQWQVLDEDGSNTNLATLSQTGVLRARGVGNGTVVVTAYSNGHSAQQEILITNQLDSNKVTITGAQKTIDFVSLRTGAAWGGNDNIQRYQGTSQQTAVSSEIFAETTGNYHQSTTLLTVPTNAFNWTVTNEAGQPTTLATVNATGLVTATGAGDGKVVVVATLINNPDIVAKRTITVQNQGTKNAVKMIQAENYDIGTGTAATTWATGGNQMGLQVPIAANATLTFKNVDFANTNPGLVAARLAPNANASVNASIEVWVDAGSVAAGGRRIGTIASATTAATNQYATYTAVVSGPVSGIHDVILRSSAAIRLNWFTFAQYDSTNLAVLAAMVNTHQSLYANQAYYTPASWTAFDTAWRAGKALVDAGSTSDVAINAAITALTAGVTGLVELVDTTLLQALVNQARSILASPGEYVSSTLTGLQAAYDAASPLVAPDATPTQAAVDAASLTLATAVQRALLKGDTTVLNALITFVGTLNPNDYTATTWAAVTTAVNQGRTVAGLPEPSKLAVDDAVAAINAALTNLLAQAVKTGLNSAIRVAQGVVDNIGAYTPSTVVGFADALNAAKAVYNDANATQAQVNAAQSALMTRILDAKLRPATSPLSSALTTAAGISLNGYSADSVAKLTAAVAAGRNLLANPEATQAAVNQQAAAIKAALKGLKTAGSTAKALKTAKPKIAGKAVVGKKVKVSKGAWTSGSTFTYRWYANGQAIAKATKASYKVKAADAGKKITVKVTAKKAGYAKAARSSKAVKVKK